MLETCITSILAFVSTNIDDLFVLMILFAGMGMQRRQIVLGQYLGIFTLVFISILGAFGLQLLPQQYIRWLGIIPIFLGVKAWREHQKEEEAIKKPTSIFSVMFLTIANGADNIGIYIPTFSGFKGGDFVVMVIVFALLVALWCWISCKLANQPLIREKIQKYQHILVPVIFIGLGIMIIFGG